MLGAAHPLCWVVWKGRGLYLQPDKGKPGARGHSQHSSAEKVCTAFRSWVRLRGSWACTINMEPSIHLLLGVKNLPPVKEASLTDTQEPREGKRSR